MQIELRDYRKRIANVIMRQLNGNFSETLTKFLYLGNGARHFLRFIQDQNYSGYGREIVLINRIMPQIAQRVRSNLQIVDLGPGNGEKAVIILGYLNEKVSDYLAIDISQEMLDIAKNNQLNRLNVNARYVEGDFSDINQLTEILDNLRITTRLFLLLGNTLTNEINMTIFLRNFRNIINLTEDYLLIGIELFNDKIKEIIREYENEDYYNLDFTPLEFLGLNRNDGTFRILFNQTLWRIEEWFIFNKDIEIRIEDREIRFRSSDRILLSVTYKPTLAQIRNIVRNSGWDEEMIALDENRSYALLLLSSNK